MSVQEGYQEYDTPGTYTFTPPVGVYFVWVRAVAGGGGGGSTVKFFAAGSPGHGGGAGESCQRLILKTTPGVGVTVVVGAGGAHGLLAVNGSLPMVSVDESGNSGFNSGNSGENTTVGNIRLLGGRPGGAGGGGTNTAGMGGGAAAGAKSGNFGAGGTDASLRIDFINGSIGFAALPKEPMRYWAGSGGATGTAIIGDGASGGPCGPFPGGAGGVANTLVGGGGGGAASIFGPGGAGGDGDSDAPAIPAGSYGAGGGGCGGNSTTYGGPTVQSYVGRDGAGGHALLNWLV